MSPVHKKKQLFTNSLIYWHVNSNKRIMPWTREKDVYKIWISEIILQQTRVEQGLEYYKNFLKKFPDIKSLAMAKEAEVFKMWEGLGYYTRAKNIHFTAKRVFWEMGGHFPQTYEAILNLKGIGPYTAAAIASFAFQLPHAVVDGNVFRVLSRFFGENIAIDSTAGKKFFSDLANQLLYKDDPAAFNQAIMDFGATVCKPQIPVCQQCIFKNDCAAFDNGMVNVLPVKEKRLLRTKRFLSYFLFFFNDKILVTTRSEKDIWRSLNEFYLCESDKPIKWKADILNEYLNRQMGIEKYTLIHTSQIYKQQLTHQVIEGQFVVIKLDVKPKSLEHFSLMTIKQIKKLAFPKIINQYLEEFPL